ncbi:ATP-binding cassette domain-containing protein [Spirochaeta africana]|uniref:ABC-type nitrate/sulfonate/bicarbonate transport system, ATPase component n=1 Tax=Spirochaeta africana (strain ATCC 700263 / DSM 8902 / Z-7692) TaxID=889378 RepID=H9ULP2_SPIAZ|nr:ATP-binding cassette domain-containing protein [Spirochaeta africana]AFG38435.1 ABC-type nitrate/sulfonate/bicarbonate transport system, ATPase component [Spirochaeta africana DSM 8902]
MTLGGTRQQKAGLIGTAVLLLIWGAAAAAVGREVLVPGPLRVLQEVGRLLQDPRTPGLVAGTVVRWLSAFLLAGLLGITTGSLGYRHSWFADGIRPLVILIRAIPVIAIILIALVWLPLSRVGVLVGLLVAYPLIHQGVLDGLRSIDPALLEMSRIFRVSLPRAIALIYLPGSLPLVLSTLTAAVGMSWKAVIAAEVLSQPARAIGTALQTAKLYIDTPQVFAWTVIAVSLAALVDGLLLLIDRRLYLRQNRPPTETHSDNSSQETARLPAVTPVAVQVEQLAFSYDTTVVFDALDLDIQPGEITVIFGPSGCGKTTLLRLIAGTLAPAQGHIHRSDHQRPATSFVFQEPRLLPWATIRRNLEPACEHLPRRIRRQGMHAMLQQVRVALPDSYPEQLSGGMQQRINLARGFLHPAGLICLDEPFANQDGATRTELLQLTLSLHRSCRPTMLWITHDPQEAMTVADRIVLLSTPGTTGTRILADYRLTGAPPAQREVVRQAIANRSES